MEADANCARTPMTRNSQEKNTGTVGTCSPNRGIEGLFLLFDY
jgi:hypothetical protein